MVYEKKYENGLRLVVKKMDGLFSVTSGIMVGTGSAFETDETDGISHFIEHMQFKGTSSKSAFELSDGFDKIGAQVNAFTSKEYTCYYVKSTSDNAEKSFDLLADMFLNSTYPEDEMAREKKVICEEIAMNEDTPDDLCLDVLAQAMYGNNYYGRNILGPEKNVQSFTFDDVKAYKAKRYLPENIVISFAGAISFETADRLVEKYFVSLEKGKFENEPKKIVQNTNSILKTKPIEQVHLAIGYPSFSRSHPLIDALSVANSVLGGGMSSRLFQTVREKLGLAYSVYSYETYYEECGSLNIYAGVNPKNADEAYHAILDCIDKLVKDGITDDEFLRGREQMKSSMLFSQESTSSQMILYGRKMLLENELYDFEKTLGKITGLTKTDVMDAVRLVFGKGEKCIGAVGNTSKPFQL